MDQAQSEDDTAHKNCLQENQNTPESHLTKKQSKQAQANWQVSSMWQAQSKEDIATVEQFTKGQSQTCLTSKEQPQQAQANSPVSKTCQALSEENLATMKLLTKSSSQTCVTKQSQQAQATSQKSTIDQAQSEDHTAHKNCSQEKQAKSVSYSLKKQSQLAKASSPVYQAQERCRNCICNGMALGQLIEAVVVIWFIFLLSQQVLKTFSVTTMHSNQSKKNMETIKLLTRSLGPENFECHIPRIHEQATTSKNQAPYCTLLFPVNLTHLGLHQEKSH
jgi:hypothetical protein